VLYKSANVCESESRYLDYQCIVPPWRWVFFSVSLTES